MQQEHCVHFEAEQKDYEIAVARWKTNSGYVQKINVKAANNAASA